MKNKLLKLKHKNINEVNIFSKAFFFKNTDQQNYSMYVWSFQMRQERSLFTVNNRKRAEAKQSVISKDDIRTEDFWYQKHATNKD